MALIHFVFINTSQIVLLHRVINHLKYLSDQPYLIKCVPQIEVLIITVWTERCSELFNPEAHG